MSRVAEEIAARYAACATYEDRGTSETVFIPDSGAEGHTNRLTFSTLFDRARGGFRFEYEKRERAGTHAAIWRSKDGPAQHWWNVDAKVSTDSLKSCVARMTGVSSGTAAMVPLMLLGERLFRPFDEVNDDVLDGAPVLRLVDLDGERATTLWVSPGEKKLLRFSVRDRLPGGVARLPRIPNLSEQERREIEEANRKARPFRIEQTVTYDAYFDRPIEASRFEFVVPAAV